MTRTLTHTQSTVTLTVTVNINADKTLLFLAGVVWLLCQHIGPMLRRVELGVLDVALGLRAWLFDDWRDDWRLICWAALLLFVRSNYGTNQA